MPHQALQHISKIRHITEGYVLLRELKLYLDVGHESYHPNVKVRIWVGTVPRDLSFSFELSHHVKTPKQTGPYHPSRVNFASEEEAIDAAITALTSFLIEAIREGAEPSDDWLVPNRLF
jgi:hypothetical protein